MKPEVRIYPDLEALSRAAADELINVYEKAILERDVFALVLSGGSTPKALYRLVATDYRDKLDWKKVHLFWGDERYVPPASPESNYGAAYMTLISKIPIPEGNVHPIPTGSDGPETDAAAYEDEIRDFLRSTGSEGFDLVLLGLGSDGHTASLFPGNPAVAERERWVAAVTGPAEYKTRQRITLTLPLINRSRNIFFMVTGSEKHVIVRSIFDKPKVQKYPASMINPTGRLIWFLDKVASGNLTL